MSLNHPLNSGTYLPLGFSREQSLPSTLKDFCRHSPNNGVRRNVLVNNGVGGNDAAIANLNTVEYDATLAKPAIVADFYAKTSCPLGANGHIDIIENMVLGMNRNIGAENAIIANLD